MVAEWFFFSEFTRLGGLGSMAKKNQIKICERGILGASFVMPLQTAGAHKKSVERLFLNVIELVV